MADYDNRLSDYVDVAERIAEFRAKYPDGSLQPLNHAEPYKIERLGDRAYVVVVAAAYRSPDDPRPGVGMAYEQWPGRTPYTRDSELQNAETSAWGRAIVAALAADTKKGVASREEVRNRSAERDLPQWDAAEQETLLAGWLAEIEDATDSTQLGDIGRRLLEERKALKLSPDAYGRAAKRGKERADEFNGKVNGTVIGASA